MNYTFDYQYMRNEMIDFALTIKNEDMFIHLTNDYYEDYIAHYLGFQDKQDFEAILRETNKAKLFVDWIEENKYKKHKMVIRYLIQHPSLIDVEDETSCEHWENISRILENNLPSDWLLHKMKVYFNETVAKDFLTYMDMYKQH